MTVFYLKYRPQKIADLDLANVRDFLIKVLASDILPQSFLFSGPKGSGKTSAARILAKNINCQEKIKGEACGKCDSCQMIESGGAGLDVIEMDAASNRGIDEVRGLKEKVYSSAVSLKNKVFVIDEAHMMTKEAFNALLKILEEPPKNVYFVLCTTNPEKIPETVLSRVVKVDFTKSSREEMISSLTKVVEGEKIVLGEDNKFILKEISDLADGSFRNGQKILMELVLFAGKKIDKNSWLEFKAKKYCQGDYLVEEVERDLISGHLVKILTNLDRMAQGGVDMSMYRQKLVEFFQTRLIETISLPKSDGLRTDRYSYLLRLLIQAGRDEKTAVISQLPLQLAIVDFFEKYNNEESGNNKIKTEVSRSRKQSSLKIEDIKLKWKDLLAAVKPYNHSVEAFLRAARPVEIDGDKIIMEVFYKFHKERLEDDRNRKIVEKGLADVFGRNLIFNCRLGQMGASTDTVAIEEIDKTDLYDVAKEIFG